MVGELYLKRVRKTTQQSHAVLWIQPVFVWLISTPVESLRYCNERGRIHTLMAHSHCIAFNDQALDMAGKQPARALTLSNATGPIHT